MNIIIVVAAAISMTIVCQKRRDLKYWPIPYILTMIGVLFSSGSNIINPEWTLGLFISRLFYIFSSITIFFIVFKEYRETYPRNKNNDTKINAITNTTLFISVLMIITIFEIIVVILNVISAIMLIRIFLKKKTFTHFFLSISLCTIILDLIFLIILKSGIEGMRLYYLGITIIFFTMLLITSFVALLDKKIMKVLFEKNELKDKYSHDLGNILHTISITYEFIKLKKYSDNELSDLDNLIKDKMSEASDLVKFIRGL
jgi:hypothetical protein